VGGENIKMKNRELHEREKKIVSILKKHTRKQNKHGQKNVKNTKKHVHFKLGGPLKKRGTRKKNQKSNPSAKQLKIRNRTLTPMPMSSSL
jgi:hypothetical protein